MQARSRRSLHECERRSPLYSLKMMSFVIEADGEFPIATGEQAMITLTRKKKSLDGPKKFYVFIRSSSQQWIPKNGRQRKSHVNKSEMKFQEAENFKQSQTVMDLICRSYIEIRKNLILNQIFGLSVWFLEMEIDGNPFKLSSDLLVINENMGKKNKKNC